MKKFDEVILSPSAGSELMMGNTAVVRAMIESGVRVVTSFPGSPTPEIATTIEALPKDRNPLYFEYSTNEKVATEVAFGASINGHSACVFFKSVGLNVAADSFVQLGHLNLVGGLVVILGDDPGANSSQNEQDNRHLARLSYIPVLEPADPQEVYDFFKQAMAISRQKQMPVILRLTTHVCHAKTKVRFGAWDRQTQDNTPRFDAKNGPYIPITSAVFPLKQKALTRLEEFRVWAETAPLHRHDDHGNPRRGIITAGLPYLSLQDVFQDAIQGVNQGTAGALPDVLKLGVVYPLPRERLAAFLSQHEEVKVLEELDDFLEQELKALAYTRGLKTRIIGKTDFDDWMGEYTADKVATSLGKVWPDLFPKKLDEPLDPHASGRRVAPPRPAQMCPGCGHRSAFHAIRKALPSESITVADIGCHTLGFLEPYRMGQSLLCMGHVGGTAAGLSLFNPGRPVVGFIGDATFFHAGIPGIVNAIFNRHNFTLILMENGTTAMTGHQDLPKIPVRQVLQGLGVTDIQEVDAYQQANLTRLVQEALLRPGFKVIIAKHPCMLKFTRENRRKGRKPLPPVEVTQACTRQLTCIREFACPAYQLAEDGSVFVQTDLCIGDGSCKQTCSTHAIQPSKE